MGSVHESQNLKTARTVTEYEQRLIELSGVSTSEVLASLETSSVGLSTKEAGNRLDQYGANEMSHARHIGFWGDIFSAAKALWSSSCW